jgi:hypothetical protein
MIVKFAEYYNNGFFNSFNPTALMIFVLFRKNTTGNSIEILPLFLFTKNTDNIFHNTVAQYYLRKKSVFKFAEYYNNSFFQ